MPTTRNLAILVFEDVEVLDFCGPFEVFTVASRFTEPPAFNVFTVAEKPGPVLTRGGLCVNPHHPLANCLSLPMNSIPRFSKTKWEDHFCRPCIAGVFLTNRREAGESGRRLGRSAPAPPW
jgi:transcriptional regulator GlxA family with amidase domain